MESLPNGVKTRTIRIPTYDGQEIDAFVAEPTAPGRHPGISFGMEAMGLNIFNRKVAVDMAAQGYVCVMPDYYRGGTPSQPDNYDDFTEVHAAITKLDFTKGTHDVMAGLDWLRSRRNVDARRLVTWGYCTGGTLSWLAAALDRELAACVLFFPSQPRFDERTPKRPVSPVDMIWNIACPTIIHYGGQDKVMQPEHQADLRQRIAQWNAPVELVMYPEAGHAFSAVRSPTKYNKGASDRSWATTLGFLKTQLAKRAA